MSKTFTAIYDNGKLISSEIPVDIIKSKVIITFLDDDDEFNNLSETTFDEWDNELDKVYDEL